MERTRVVGEAVERQRYNVDEYPLELRKKVILLEHFSKYLLSGRKCPSNEEAKSLLRGSKTREMEYVRKWHRLQHAIIFRLDNSVIQVPYIVLYAYAIT